jgi:hypothetical protein
MFVQSVLPKGQLAYQDIHATPESFGGQVGQTLQQSGNMFDQQAVARQQIINAANIDDAYANKFDPAFRQMCMDFLKLKGKNAGEQFPIVQQQMKDLATQTAASLPNDLQRHTFNEISRRRMMSDLDGMARHVAAETNSWVAGTGNAMMDVYTNRIIDNRYDFDKVAGPGGFIQNIKNLSEAQGDLFGQPAAYANVAANRIDKALSDAIRTEAAMNPTGAKMLYDRYAQYMSSDKVRQDVLNPLLPAMRREQNTAVYGDVMSRFNLNGPDFDIDGATKWVMDPNNYKDQLSDSKQREDIARAMQGEWNRARQVCKDNQSLADNAFTDAVARQQISGMGLQTWRDPKTGLPPSSDILQAAMEHDVKPIEPNVSNRDTLVSLTNNISNRRMSDPGPINEAYLRNLITSQDFRNLTALYDTYRDPAKSRWFDYAKDAFFARFGDSTPPSSEASEFKSGRALPPASSNGASADAMVLFPRYLTGLDQAVREQNLKSIQIRDAVDKMLKDLDRTYVGQSFGKMGSAPASQANQPSTAPTSEPTLQVGEAAASPEDHSRGVLSSVPEQMIRTDRESAPDPAMEWTGNYLRKNHPAWPLTAPNIEAAHDQFKAQDPEFWRHWIIKGD